jgi:hypothetical protein
MGSGQARIFNLLSIVFLALTLGELVVFAILLGQPIEEEALDVSLIPTDVVLPTLTPSFTPTTTPTSTFTPFPTFTISPTPSPTASITTQPTATITNTPAPSLTASNTPTLSIAPTEAASSTPAGPTATFTATSSPYLFEVNGQPFLGANVVNTTGCAWQGIGGSVVDQTGMEVQRPFQVRVYSSGFERIVPLGNATYYAPLTGWEVVISPTGPVPGIYFAELQSGSGQPISAPVEINFPGTCEANSAIVVFRQIRDF